MFFSFFHLNIMFLHLLLHQIYPLLLHEHSIGKTKVFFKLAFVNKYFAVKTMKRFCAIYGIPTLAGVVEPLPESDWLTDWGTERLREKPLHREVTWFTEILHSGTFVTEYKTERPLSIVIAWCTFCGTSIFSMVFMVVYDL